MPANITSGRILTTSMKMKHELRLIQNNYSVLEMSRLKTKPLILSVRSHPSHRKVSRWQVEEEKRRRRRILHRFTYRFIQRSTTSTKKLKTVSHRAVSPSLSIQSRLVITRKLWFPPAY